MHGIRRTEVKSLNFFIHKAGQALRLRRTTDTNKVF